MIKLVLYLILQVNEGQHAKTDRLDIPVLNKRQPISSAQNPNRRNFVSNNNSNAPNRTKHNRGSGPFNTDPEIQVANPRNLDRANYHHNSDSKSSNYNRFTKHALESASLLGSSNEHSHHHPHHHHNNNTRRFESRKSKNEREVDFATARQAPQPVTGIRKCSEGSDDFQAAIEVPRSPTGSDIDENLWLDVEPGADFEFHNDLESMKMDFNNEIDDLNNEQIQNELLAVGGREISRKAAPAAERQPVINYANTGDAIKQGAEKDFDLNKFMENGSSVTVPRSTTTQGSRLQRLFNTSADQNRNLGAEYDRYLQSFEFDPETNDLRRYIQPIDPPTPQTNNHFQPNGMNFNGDLSYKTQQEIDKQQNQQMINNQQHQQMLNNQQQKQQPQTAPRSRFAHWFVSDVNQNNLPPSSNLLRDDNQKNNMQAPLNVKTTEAKVQVLSLADIESDVSPVPHGGQSAALSANMQANLSKPNVISADALERDLLAQSPPKSKDNDLSAFTSLLNQLGGGKNVPAGDINEGTSNEMVNRPVYSPGPEIIQDQKKGSDPLYARRITGHNVNNYQNMPSKQVDRNTGRQNMLPEVATLNQQESNRSSREAHLNEYEKATREHRQIQQANSRNQVNMNEMYINETNNSLQQQTSNLPPNLEVFKRQIALQQHINQQRQQQQQNLQQQELLRNAVQQGSSAVGGPIGNKQRGGPSDIFTPTAVMRNLSMDNPASSAQTASTSNSYGLQSKHAVNLSNFLQANQDPRVRDMIFKMNQETFARLGMPLSNTSNTTQALQSAQLSTSIAQNTRNVPKSVNPAGTIGSNNALGNTNLAAASVASSQPASTSAQMANVPIVGPPIVSPWLINSMMRPAAQPLVVPQNPSPQLAQQAIQSILVRQQIAAALMLNGRPPVQFRPMNAPAQVNPIGSQNSNAANLNSSNKNGNLNNLSNGVATSASMFQQMNPTTEQLLNSLGLGSSVGGLSAPNQNPMNGLNLNRNLPSPMFDPIPGSRVKDNSK